MSRQDSIIHIAHVALIGFGEAGSLLAEGLVRNGVTVNAYDILWHDVQQRAALQQKAGAAGVCLHDSLAGALNGADLVISAVTASSANEAAVAAAGHMGQGQFFMDINSVSPHTKQLDEAALVAAGVGYVEAAVMAPVPPYGLSVPILLGGACAAALAPVLNTLGFNTRAVADTVGVASAIKMCRSVMIKGIEALTVECLRAAQVYDAQDEVLASLEETFPGLGWTQQLPHYLVSRVAEHGRRRAAEMREVADTLLDAGVQPLMTRACVQVQDGLVDDMQAAGVSYPEGDFDWPDFFTGLKA